MSEGQEPEQKPIRGGRNLTIFGIIAIVIAIITSGVSLFIYTATGDIYLDRSRPGFIFEDENKDEDKDKVPEKEITFSADGAVDSETLDDYLEKFDSVLDEIVSNPEAFSADALSDETLNITGSADY